MADAGADAAAGKKPEFAGLSIQTTANRDKKAG